MIIEALFLPFFILAKVIVSMLPTIQSFTNTSDSSFLEIIRVGLYFFGTAPWIMCLSSVIMWNLIQFAWAVIEWVYIKIPGVN